MAFETLLDVDTNRVVEQQGENEFYSPSELPENGTIYDVPLPTLKDELQVINPDFTNPILSQNMLISSEPQPQPTTNTNTVYETISSLNTNTNDVLGAETSVLNTGLVVPVTGWKAYLPYIFAIIGIALTVYQLTKKNKKY